MADKKPGKAEIAVAAVLAAEAQAEADVAAAKALVPPPFIRPSDALDPTFVTADVASDGSVVIVSGRGNINLQPADALAVGLWLVDAYKEA